MEINGIYVHKENPFVTLKKVKNKSIFDKSWFEDYQKMKENHYRQMSIIIAYCDKL